MKSDVKVQVLNFLYCQGDFTVKQLCKENWYHKQTKQIHTQLWGTNFTIHRKVWIWYRIPGYGSGGALNYEGSALNICGGQVVPGPAFATKY